MMLVNKLSYFNSFFIVTQNATLSWILFSLEGEVAIFVHNAIVYFANKTCDKLVVA